MLGSGSTNDVMPDIYPAPRPQPPRLGGGLTKRRRFTAAYKLHVLRELDVCTLPGEAGAILRREGLYSSHITQWRRKRAAGELQALSPVKQGRPRKPRSRLAPEVDRLQRENARLQEELRKARLIISVQKKVAEMLGDPENSESD